MLRLLSLEHRLQEQRAGCLVACTQMVLLHLGHHRTQAELGQVLGLTTAGIPAFRISRIAELGFSVTYCTGSESDLRQLVDQGVAPIIFLTTADLPYWLENVQHAVVFVGYDDESVFLNDPVFAAAPKQVNWGDFLLAWSEFDNRFAVILPMS